MPSSLDPPAGLRRRAPRHTAYDAVLRNFQLLEAAGAAAEPGRRRWKNDP